MADMALYSVLSLAGGPGWWAGDGGQVVTIVQCDGPDINILAAIHQTTVGGGAGLPRPPPPPAALPLSACSPA